MATTSVRFGRLGRRRLTAAFHDAMLEDSDVVVLDEAGRDAFGAGLLGGVLGSHSWR
jgi:hypothetical protein